MGTEAIILAIIVGAFSAFAIAVGYVNVIASAKAITWEQEQAARAKSTPVAPSPVAFKHAA